MGNTAKTRLQLMAAQFKANNQRHGGGGANPAGMGGGYLGGDGGAQPQRSEMRGLLDDDTADMELASRKDL